MNNKENLKELVKHLPKELNYTVASEGTYIYSGLLFPISFEVFITEDSLGLKSPAVNLKNEMVEAISTILESKKIGDFKHRTYGSNKTQWSIWEMGIEGLGKEEIPEILKKLMLPTL